MRNFKVSERLTMRTSGIDRYLSEVSKIPMITIEEEEALAIRSISGDIEARDKLVNSNLRFVVSVAKMYHNGNASRFEDLINEGNQGLIEAAEQFDTTTGFKFISFAPYFSLATCVIENAPNIYLCAIDLNPSAKCLPFKYNILSI